MESRDDKFVKKENAKNNQGGQEINKNSDGLLQLVSFTLGKEEFGVEILKVQEINRVTEITNVPQSPDFVEGIINLRGRVIPVINLRKRFGLTNEDFSKDTRIVVVEIDGKTVGFIVDSVKEVLRISANTIEPPPPIVAGIDADYIEGIGKLEDRLLIMLNLNRILSNQEIDQLKKVA